MKKMEFRAATRADVRDILALITELAVYEELLHEVVATEELLIEWLFDKEKVEVIMGEVEGELVGFVLFFQNFSTFLGRGGIYLEDLYIKKEHRGQGYGTAFIKELARIAKERQCGRLEWSCLDDNHPSYQFYLSLGAQPMTEWTVFRATGETLDKLATSE